MTGRKTDNCIIGDAGSERPRGRKGEGGGRFAGRKCCGIDKRSANKVQCFDAEQMLKIEMSYQVI